MSRIVRTAVLLLCGVSVVTLGLGLYFRDKPDMDAVIHGYLLAHPEVLREMSAKLTERDRAERQARFKEALPGMREQLAASGQLGVSGNPKGDITIVEFYDVECPFCKALAPQLDRLVKDDEFVRVVYREFPILGEMSIVGARAEIAAEKQGLYETFHAALMADRTPEHQLTEKHIFELAASSGLNVNRLKTDMADPEVNARIEAYKVEAAKLTISGTPGLVFLGPGNKENYLSAQGMGYDEMKAKLAELRLAAR